MWAGHSGTLISQSAVAPQNAVLPKKGHPPQRLLTQWQLWAKPVGGRRIAIVAVNFDGLNSTTVPLAFAQFPVQWWGDTKQDASTAIPTSVQVRDVWTGKDLGVRTGGRFEVAAIPPRACRMLLLSAAAQGAGYT